MKSLMPQKTVTTQPKSELEALQQAVEGLHNCKAKYKRKTHVKEAFRGEMVWDGDVYIFDVTDHPSANLAYAWSSPVEGSDNRRLYAVLHTPVVNTPKKAVLAAIVHDYRQKRPS